MRRDAPVKRLGNYELLRKLGAGGQAVVYEARDTELDRRVALKVLVRGARSEESVARLMREARATARLDHPNIVAVFDVGEWRGRRYLAMELVEGESLQGAIQRGAVSVRGALAVTYLIARAAHHAHEHGVIHRDIKPANILLDASGTPMLTDFGFALDAEGHDRLTQTGTTLGTPGYMSPEQAKGASGELDARSDVHAIGAVFYTMLAGRPPFEGATALDVLHKVVHEKPRPPSEFREAMPPEIETICLKCLEKDPARRYRTAAELAEDCRRFFGREAITARPAGLFYRARELATRRKAVAAVLLLTLLAGSAIEIRTRAAIRAEEKAADQALADTTSGRAAVQGARLSSEALRREIDQVKGELARLRDEEARLMARTVRPYRASDVPGTPEARAGPEPATKEQPLPVERAPPGPARPSPGYFVEAEIGAGAAHVVELPGASGGRAVADFNATGRKTTLVITLKADVPDAAIVYRAFDRFRGRGRSEGEHTLVFKVTPVGLARPSVRTTERAICRGRWVGWTHSPLGVKVGEGRRTVSITCTRGDGGSALDVVGIVSRAELAKRPLPNIFINDRLEEDGCYIEVPPAKAPSKVVETAAASWASDSVRNLIADLRDEDSGVRARAARYLARAGDRAAVGALIRALGDEDAAVRYESVYALGRLKDLSALSALASALTDADEGLRERAAVALGRLGDRKAVPMLLKSLQDPAGSVRVRAASSLAWLGDAAAVPHLIRALGEDSSVIVRQRAASALAMLGDRRAVSPLVKALEDSQQNVRAAAGHALGGLGDRSAVPALMTALRKEIPTGASYSASEAFVTTLGNLKAREAVPLIVKTLGSEFTSLRRRSVLALYIMADRAALPGLRRRLPHEKDARVKALIEQTIEKLTR